MVDENNDVDPENPRPEGHYPRFRDNTWHYVPDELAQTISLGPGGDGEPGQDWVLTYTPERENEEDREKVLVRLTPKALQELYIETKDSRTTTGCMGTVRSVIYAVNRLTSSEQFLTNATNPYIGTATKKPTAVLYGLSEPC